MRNFDKKFIVLLTFIFSSMSMYAQPDLTIWRVDQAHINDGHGDGGGHTKEEGIKELWPCASSYYQQYTGEDIEYIFQLRNDGNQDLQLRLPLRLVRGATSNFVITTQPTKGTLAPGEEETVIITYNSPSSYVDGHWTALSIKNSSGNTGYCGFGIEVGIEDPPVVENCYCDQGELVTVDDGGFIFGGLNPEPGRVFLHSGPCVEEDVCPTDEEVTCYFSPFLGGFQTLINDQPIWLPFNFLVPFSEGYCPCILDTEVCLDGTCGPFPGFGLPRGVPDRNAIGSRGNPDICMGDDVTIFLDDCITEISNASVRPEDAELTWCYDGVGTVVDLPEEEGPGIVVSGWITGEQVTLKVTEMVDGEECIAAQIYPLGYEDPEYSLQIESPTCQGAALTICRDEGYGSYSSSSVRTERDGINGRSLDVTWEIFGDGMLTNPTTDEDGACCITVIGASIGDLIVASEEPEDEGDCLIQNSYTVTGLEFFDCEFSAQENFNPLSMMADLDDPCNCTDPLNIFDGIDIEYFHDVLTITTDPVLPGAMVTITNLQNWFDSNGDPVAGPLGLVTDLDGTAQLDFWHLPGVSATADVDIDGLPTFFFPSSICEPCAFPGIPTLGQWAIMILGIGMVIVGLIYIRQTSKEVIRN